MNSHILKLKKEDFSSLHVSNKKIKVCLGWCENPLTLHVVSCNMLRDFEFVHHNVSVDDMNDKKLEYAKFGKVGLNNHTSLSHSNILQGPINGLVFVRRSTWAPLSPTLHFTCARVANST